MTEREWYNLEVGDIIKFYVVRDDRYSLKSVVISISKDKVVFENTYYSARTYYDFKILLSPLNSCPNININLRESILIKKS